MSLFHVDAFCLILVTVRRVRRVMATVKELSFTPA
jgi:hypothetical protein